jgi:hypothetical protein
MLQNQDRAITKANFILRKFCILVLLLLCCSSCFAYHVVPEIKESKTDNRYFNNDLYVYLAENLRTEHRTWRADKLAETLSETNLFRGVSRVNKPPAKSLIAVVDSGNYKYCRSTGTEVVLTLGLMPVRGCRTRGESVKFYCSKEGQAFEHGKEPSGVRVRATVTHESLEGWFGLFAAMNVFSNWQLGFPDYDYTELMRNEILRQYDKISSLCDGIQ